MGANDIPTWVKTWGGIATALVTTFVVINNFTGLFKESKPPEPVPIHIVLPDEEPPEMGVLRIIDKNVNDIKLKMGIRDSNVIGKTDSVEHIIDSLATTVGGR